MSDRMNRPGWTRGANDGIYVSAVGEVVRYGGSTTWCFEAEWPAVNGDGTTDGTKACVVTCAGFETADAAAAWGEQVVRAVASATMLHGGALAGRPEPPGRATTPPAEHADMDETLRSARVAFVSTIRRSLDGETDPRRRAWLEGMLAKCWSDGTTPAAKPAETACGTCHGRGEVVCCERGDCEWKGTKPCPTCAGGAGE